MPDKTDFLFGRRAKNLRGIKCPERGNAFDQGYLDLPNACEIEFGLRCGADVLEDDFALASPAILLANRMANHRAAPEHSAGNDQSSPAIARCRPR